MADIQIGELSRRTGCNIETIRYYERIALLPRPPRSASRYRLYDSDDMHRLTFVRRARELGFSLDEVRALLALSGVSEQVACIEVRQLAAGHLVDIRAKDTWRRFSQGQIGSRQSVLRRPTRRRWTSTGV